MPWVGSPATMVLNSGSRTAITWHGSLQQVGALVRSSTQLLSQVGGEPHVCTTRPYSYSFSHPCGRHALPAVPHTWA
jgi:hypothetical protein